MTWNSCVKRSPSGVDTTVFFWITSSPASRTRMRILSASTAVTGKRCWIHRCLAIWTRSGKSAGIGAGIKRRTRSRQPSRAHTCLHQAQKFYFCGVYLTRKLTNRRALISPGAGYQSPSNGSLDWITWCFTHLVCGLTTSPIIEKTIYIPVSYLNYFSLIPISCRLIVAMVYYNYVPRSFTVSPL